MVLAVLCSGQLGIIIAVGGDWEGLVFPWAQLGPRPAPEPRRLSGVYGIEATTLWDLACFPSALSCLVSIDLAYRFMHARPPQCSPTSLL